MSSLPQFHLTMDQVEAYLAEHHARQEPEPAPTVDLGNIQLKTCGGGCGESLPATPEYFYRHRTGRDGLDWRCKTCKLAYDRERRAGSKRPR